MNSRPNGEIELAVPYWLDWALLKYKLCCCLRSADFKEYDDSLKRARSQCEIDLDIFRILRRNRMHGFALLMKVNQSLKRSSANLAFSQPLQTEIELKMFEGNTLRNSMDKWYHIEHIRKKDLFMVALFKRYAQYFDPGKELKAVAELESRRKSRYIDPEPLENMLKTKIDKTVEIYDSNS